MFSFGGISRAVEMSIEEAENRECLLGEVVAAAVHAANEGHREGVGVLDAGSVIVRYDEDADRCEGELSLRVERLRANGDEIDQLAHFFSRLAKALQIEQAIRAVRRGN